MADRTYDVSTSEKRLVDEYAKRRAALRHEYIKQITNPHRHGTGEGGTVFDVGVQRFMAMRATEFDHFKPSPKSSLFGLGLVVIPIAVYAYMLKSWKEKEEHKYRTGQVAYKDRRFKFI
ncbi:NADH dehydrogenase [ubiquinone] 1 beta subcomplex subunit 4 [Periplaneta americana]|uniref:NADH dehydrogenase [ubiquinone] 1 beta subcomplex subunit 4 n=1 Tax=Periplaneta americana TaxID=6978 RepID=UPI0037E96946